MLLDGYYYYMWQCISIRMSGGLQFKGAHPPSLLFFGACVASTDAQLRRSAFYYCVVLFVFFRRRRGGGDWLVL